MEKLLALSEVIRKRAVHITGRYFLDNPTAVRRYGVIEVTGGGGGEEPTVEVTRSANPPKDFPQDRWILLEA
jgi:hypothetical protein